MDEQVLSFFKIELQTQCYFVVRAAADLDASLDTNDVYGIWFSLQAILISASNASKLLWGSREGAVPETRRPLREAVEVTDASPLNSRRLRSDFERFDERLEHWLAQGEHSRRYGRKIGPISRLPDGNNQPATLLGHFDPRTDMVYFWDRSANVRLIIVEAYRILDRIGSGPSTMGPG